MTVLDHRYYHKSLGDFSSLANHGNKSGDVGWIEKDGVWCLDFGGTSSEIDCGTDSSLDLTGSYTIAALASASGVSSHGVICGRYDNSETKGFLLRFESTGAVRFTHLVQGTTEGGALSNNILSTTLHDDGAFHWIIGRFTEGVGSELYVDSVHKGSATTRTDGIASFAQTFYVGRQDHATANRLIGQVAEVKIWPNALNDADINREMLKARAKLSRRGHSAQSYFFLMDGQSLSTGVKGQPAVSTTARFGESFSGGPRSDVDELDWLEPLIENDNTGPDGNSQSGETICYGSVQKAFELGGYQLVSSTVGHAGYSITQLIKGTAWYDYLIAHMKAAYDLKTAQGDAFVLAALGWFQGESDNTMAVATYKGHMLQLLADVEADAKLIMGQTSKVHLISYQMSYYSRITPNVAIAQREMDRDEAYVHVALPMYFLPYVDGAHLTNIGYAWASRYMGRAFDSVIKTGDWKPVRPTSVTLNGKIFTVNFEVPSPPLVIDAVNVGQAQDDGFRALDDGGLLTPNRIEVVAPTQVEIEVDEVVGANPRIRYARDYLGSGMTITGGASGNLRDSDPGIWRYSSVDYNLYNWCVHFEQYV